MIPPDSRSYPYLALAQRLGLDYGMVLTEAGCQEWALGLGPLPPGAARHEAARRAAGGWHHEAAQVRRVVEHVRRRSVIGSGPTDVGAARPDRG